MIMILHIAQVNLLLLQIFGFINLSWWFVFVPTFTMLIPWITSWIGSFCFIVIFLLHGLVRNLCKGFRKIYRI